MTTDTVNEMYALHKEWQDATLRLKFFMAKNGYPMCEPQPVQLDCRMMDCVFHKDAKCTHAAPAVTLNEGGKFVCWTNIKQL